MKMKHIFSLIFLVAIANFCLAQKNIAEARSMVGQTITVSGIVTNGPELGVIRYMQDGTGGLAAYGSALTDVKNGDSITVTGTLKAYNNLLEIDPISSVKILSSGNQEPAKAVVSIPEIGEKYEGQLIEIKNVTFNNGGSLFEGNKSYTFTTSEGSGVLRVNKGTTSIVGQIIPTGEVDLVSICSQFSYTANDTLTGYQMLPRSMSDFIVEGAIHFTSAVQVKNLDKNSFTLNWKTNVSGSTDVSYGFSSDKSTWDKKATGSETKLGDEYLHSIELTGLEAGSIVYLSAFSIHKSDTASTDKVFATVSNSSGDIKVYFNTPVDTTVSKGVNANYLNQAIDDTLISYINRATESIDFTIYNFNNSNISNISEALNAAYKRGVKIRLISCGTALNLALNDLAPEVPALIAPTSEKREGIMHNKFVVFDAHADDPNVPIVWTGATNFTDGQINTDPNNVIIFQDQSLALAYEIEFEEMWGSSTETPSSENARFGAFKKDNTPHEFIIGGKNVECYFSPSDGTNQKLIDAINSADNDLSIATMVFTRSDLAYSIKDAKTRGAVVNILTNAVDGNTELVNDILTSALGVQHYVYDDYVLGIMHHKYAVIDQDKPDSDPIVITGSHNWSAAANDKNDENTVIVHDATIANIYYQQFVWNFIANHGSFDDVVAAPVAVNDSVSVTKNGLVSISVLDNDLIASSVDLVIETNAKNGNSFIPFTSPNAISYQAKDNFVGIDSIVYKIVYQTDNSLFDYGTIYISVLSDVGVNAENQLSTKIMPNPASDILKVISSKDINSVSVFDMDGKILLKKENCAGKSDLVDISKLRKGIYILQIQHSDNQIRKMKLIKN